MYNWSCGEEVAGSQQIDSPKAGSQQRISMSLQAERANDAAPKRGE